MLLAALPAALASGWVGVDESGQCTKTHPPRHRIAVVQDTYKKREDLAAVEDATRRRALEQLILGACPGKSPAQCQRIRGEVGVDVAVDLDRRVVCAAAIVAAEVVQDPDGHRALDMEVRRGVRALADALGGIPVGSVEVRWASGCGAGLAGARLESNLRAALAAVGATVTDGSGARVVAMLTPGMPATMELWHYPEAGPGRMEAAARLSPGWLGVFGDVGDQCHPLDAFQLAAGQRPGDSGLRVRLDLPIEGALCPGEEVEAVVRPSATAQVQVWSVARSGDAWLTWSSTENADGPIESRVGIQMQAAHVPGLGEEQLVVVATPPGVLWQGGPVGCRVDRLPVPPSSAALAALPFSVLAPGRDRCPVQPMEDAPSAAEFQGAPRCPQAAPNARAE